MKIKYYAKSILITFASYALIPSILVLVNASELGIFILVMVLSLIVPWPILLFETGRDENLIIAVGNIILGTPIVLYTMATNSTWVLFWIFIAPLMGGSFHALFTYETYESRERRLSGIKVKTSPSDKLLNIVTQIVVIDILCLIAIMISGLSLDSMIVSIWTIFNSLTAITVSIASVMISRQKDT